MSRANRCYAAALGNCDSTASREHWFSESICHLIAGPEKKLQVRGAHWQGHSDTETEVSPNALAAKVLCRKHNTLLSHLDSEALRFFRVLRHETSEFDAEVDGHLIERWCLKVLLGLEASAGHSIQDPWLRVLFGEIGLPSDVGLCVPIAGAKMRAVYNCFYCTSHYSDSNHSVIAGLELMASWVPIYLQLAEGIGPAGCLFAHHPSGLEMHYPDRTKKVTFIGWSGAKAQLALHLPVVS